MSGTSLLADNSFVSSDILPFQSGESLNFSVGQSNSDSPTIQYFAETNFSSSKVSIRKLDILINDNLFKIGSSESGFPKHSSTQIGSFERGVIQIAPIEKNTIQTTVIKDSSTHGDILDSSPIQVSLSKTGSFQVGIVEHGILEINPRKVSTYQNDSSQIQVIQTGTTPINSSEVSFSSPNQSFQLLSIHDLIPQLVSTLYSNTRSFWDNTTPFNLKSEVTDLPTGQLAEASITGFDPTGRPNPGTLLLDTDANGLG